MKRNRKKRNIENRDKKTLKRAEIYRKYCTGCGACAAEGVAFSPDERGFDTPGLQEKDVEFCSGVCPAAGKAFRLQQETEWGYFNSCRLSWSTDAELRHHASSGGTLTALCLYLLETGCVDGIIQTRVSPEDPALTVTDVCTTRDEVIASAGSRYTTSSPLRKITDQIEPGRKYAFVGKPCDTSALTAMIRAHYKNLDQIKYVLSFFCAGQPSREANLRLLRMLGCETADECESLTYRGNGWPGFASAAGKDGMIRQMSYHDSWGKILGRDIRLSCRLCADGVGEFSDLSCGDAWYMTEDRRPDFSEHEGRNVTFTRSEKGKKLLEDAAAAGYLRLEDYDLAELQYVQRFQFERKRNLRPQISAMRLAGRPVPFYDAGKLRAFNRPLSPEKNLRRFAGTLRRIMKGKI